MVLTWKQFRTLLIFNFTIRLPKILGKISKFILIIAEFNKNNCLQISMKQLPLELFKSVVSFLGHPVAGSSKFVESFKAVLQKLSFIVSFKGVTQKLLTVSS